MTGHSESRRRERAASGGVEIWPLALLAAGALLLGGCGGGGTGVNDGNSAPATANPPARIFFDKPATVSIFANGTIAFRISPALQATERLSCELDAAAVGPCVIAPNTGEIRFAAMSPGIHELRVRVTDSAGNGSAQSLHNLRIESADVVVFGATPGGIAAAISAARSGQSVALLAPTRWLGGTMSGGLSKTDIGPRGAEIIGGIAAEFFERVRQIQSAANTCAPSCTDEYDLEPHVAGQVFEDMLGEAHVIVERSASLQEVTREGSRIHRLTTSRGEVSARIFIDASYEGDLMERAGIPYVIARERRHIANTSDPDDLALQEDYAGVRRYVLPSGGLRVDPYVVAGDPTSGVLPYIEPGPETLWTEGDGDPRIMAYTYRLCVTDDPSNRIPFEPPADFDPRRYEAMGRLVMALRDSGVDPAVRMFNPAQTVRSRGSAYFKYDLNGGSTFSIDMTGPGFNQRYVEGTELEREQVRAAYRQYIRGLLYFWQTDPRFAGLNEKIARFGLCADEFVDNGGWPHQLYVRVARRMLGAYVMREADVLRNGRRPPISDPVGFGAYDIDMHSHRYFAGRVNWPDGTRREAIAVEGFLIVHLPNDQPYPVSYRALVPHASDATNFLNPVTLSASYVAYSSLRMEPTFMILGESAGVAAALAIELGVAVQDVPYEMLRTRLLDRGQRIGS